MITFHDLGLSPGFLATIHRAGFSTPSEIQEKTIPLVLAGKDVIGTSATGSGKTLAFGAGLIEKIHPGKGIQALILTPTRELAEQVGETLQRFSQHARLRVTQIYGGVGMGPQIHALGRADIVVGTPGRILDHLQQRTLRLHQVQYLVLDEADRMLDMGFIRDVDKIIKHCPANRQTLLFSATLSKEVEALSARYMKHPTVVSVNDMVDPTQLYQTYYDISQELKFSLLVHLLRKEKNGVVMVFCNTRRGVDHVTRALHDSGFDALAIHGGLSQNKRNSTLAAFHKKHALILVCTDVAARGLDIKDVSHVYNFDLPKVNNDYIHRIGRTARAGKNGTAISFVSPGQHSEFRALVKEKSLPLERLEVPQELKSLGIEISAPSYGRMGGRGGGRRGGGGRARGHHGGNRGGRFGRGNDRSHGHSRHGRGGENRNRYNRGSARRFR